MLKSSPIMSFCVQQNRSLIITCGAILGMILYLNWASLIQKQQEISVQRSLSETLLILRELQTNGFAQRNSHPDKTRAINDLGAPPPTKNKEEFTVAERGFWKGLGATKGHMFDGPLAAAIVTFFQGENVTTILELGAGTGTYAKQMKAAEIFVSCYDGNPETQDLSEGRCAVVDLSKPIEFPKHDWTLSLEVGEHIPKEFEDVFISNLVKSNKHGMVLSWAVEGQGGTSHVNNRNNDYVRSKIVSNGYNSDFEGEKALRAAATFDWFKKTIMVFRKQL